MLSEIAMVLAQVTAIIYYIDGIGEDFKGKKNNKISYAIFFELMAILNFLIGKF